MTDVAEGRDPLITWTSLRFLLINSNMLPALLGAAVLFGLPQALFTFDQTCAPAKAEAIAAAKIFAVYSGAVVLTLALYALSAPATIKDYMDQASFANRPVGYHVVSNEIWMKTNKYKNKKRRAIVITAAATTSILYALFLYFCYQFLDHSKDCRSPPPTPSPPLQCIVVSPLRQDSTPTRAHRAQNK